MRRGRYSQSLSGAFKQLFVVAFVKKRLKEVAVVNKTLERINKFYPHELLDNGRESQAKKFPWKIFPPVVVLSIVNIVLGVLAVVLMAVIF